jgi:DNA invertase Pin-like site-specific DNA recombinase
MAVCDIIMLGSAPTWYLYRDRLAPIGHLVAALIALSLIVAPKVRNCRYWVTPKRHSSTRLSALHSDPNMSYKYRQRTVTVLMDGRFISYLRVSTTKQGKAGLGMEAQRAAVEAFLNGGTRRLIAEFVEVESGKNDDRPQLAKTIEHCRLTGATLLVAKLDRLSRDAAFLMNLSKSGTGIRACDMPEANTMMFGIMALVAQHEREMISRRTKEALGAAKKRGVRLGGFRGVAPDAHKASEARQKAADAFSTRVAPIIQEMRQDGSSLGQIAGKLNADGIKTAAGGQWYATTVKNALNRFSRIA